MNHKSLAAIIGSLALGTLVAAGFPASFPREAGAFPIAANFPAPFPRDAAFPHAAGFPATFPREAGAFPLT
ncbi:Hypothetical protein A7982_04907 [Minicystis rosea]|nr:Hypothetical protein A7982_04907 [Minicystis rosea]